MQAMLYALKQVVQAHILTQNHTIPKPLPFYHSATTHLLQGRPPNRLSRLYSHMTLLQSTTEHITQTTQHVSSMNSALYHHYEAFWGGMLLLQAQCLCFAVTTFGCHHARSAFRLDSIWCTISTCSCAQALRERKRELLWG